MPSQRKRIGFLPRKEVQNIIDRICKHNKLSQSKVTGILVEEALSFRGVLSDTLNDKSKKLINHINSSVRIENNSFNNESHVEKDDINLNESYIKDEVKMINQFIEYKFFKNIMNKKIF